ncbi:hypothetical protein QJQ19_26125, partial [Escherichia coli]|uniref:hypothetical protein n=1 Tax=Escherichia coli TaxID=562 RepID=UPI003D6EFD67
ILTFQNHTNRPLTDFGGKTSIFSHPVYLFLREFSLQDFRGGSVRPALPVQLPHLLYQLIHLCLLMVRLIFVS